MSDATLQDLLTLGAQIGVFAAVGLVGLLIFPKSGRWKWLLLAMVLYCLNTALLTRGFRILPELVPDARWNWTGKTLSFIGMMIVVSLPVFGWRKVGLTWSQGPRPGAAYALFAALMVLIITLNVANAGGPSDLETILFQWTMPGLEEELFFSGLLLFVMNEAFPNRTRIFGTPIGYGGLMVALLFGLVHALEVGQAGLSFDGMAMALTGGPSLFVLWIRERTGSIVLPVVGHNVSNGIGTVI
ncbi:MAG: CPBP family intramembrane glutamic endopeptidase [Alphaproteobacteria bacterium]